MPPGCFPAEVSQGHQTGRNPSLGPEHNRETIYPIWPRNALGEEELKGNCLMLIFFFLPTATPSALYMAVCYEQRADVGIR